MTTRVEQTVKQNATFTSDTYVYKKQASQAIIDLSSATANCNVRQSNSETAALIIAPTVTLGGMAGTIVLSLTAAQTLGLTPGVYWYDLFILGADSTPSDKAMSGRFIVEASVS